MGVEVKQIIDNDRDEKNDNDDNDFYNSNIIIVTWISIMMTMIIRVVINLNRNNYVR